MNIYWNVTVSVLVSDEKGKAKRKSEIYLVSAVSVTDAEVKVTGFLPNTFDFEVKSVTKSKVIDVIA